MWRPTLSHAKNRDNDDGRVLDRFTSDSRRRFGQRLLDEDNHFREWFLVLVAPEVVVAVDFNVPFVWFLFVLLLLPRQK